VKRWIALEHLAAASALAGTHILRLLLCYDHSHDVHRGLLLCPSRGRPRRLRAGTGPIVPWKN